MHCNIQFFHHSSFAESNQNDQVCLVLTDFPQKTDLFETKSLILEEFTFVNKVEVRNNFEIQCYFDSMTDLIELDQGRKYGACRAFIRNIDKKASKSMTQDDIQKPKGVFTTSSQTFESQTVVMLSSYKYIPSVQNTLEMQQSIDPRLLHYPRIQRLTSLQDEIEELEHIRKQFGLFNDQINQKRTGLTEVVGHEILERFVEKQENQNKAKIICQDDRVLVSEIYDDTDQESDEKVNIKPTGKEMLFSLIEGAALTVILIGGLKLFRTFMS